MKSWNQFLQEIKESEQLLQLLESLDLGALQNSETFQKLYNDKLAYAQYLILQKRWINKKAKKVNKNPLEIGRSLSDEFRELYWGKIWEQATETPGRADIYQFIKDIPSDFNEKSIEEIAKILGDENYLA